MGVDNTAGDGLQRIVADDREVVPGIQRPDAVQADPEQAHGARQFRLLARAEQRREDLRQQRKEPLDLLEIPGRRLLRSRPGSMRQPKEWKKCISPSFRRVKRLPS